MRLDLEIALTHVRGRARQTLVAIFGVATGVGFSIMMAALMEGSQDDFITRLIDALPHVAISDDRDKPTFQPSEAVYEAVEIHGLTPEVRRPGIKNPKATIASLEAWIPGSVTPSVNSHGILRYAARDVAVSITGIEPNSEIKVSSLDKHMREGNVDSLFRATNAIILGDRLAKKLGAGMGSTLSVISSTGVKINAFVVGVFHSGVLQNDEQHAYVLLKTAQILENQTGLVNEIRIRVADPIRSLPIAQRIAADTGYKAVSWEEANADLLSAFKLRNIVMLTVVGAILLVASFGTFNIISTITHEKARDIAIMKSLGLSERLIKCVFIYEALAVGVAGSLIGFVLGYLLSLGLGTIEMSNPFMDSDRLPMRYDWRHYVIASSVALASSFIAGYWPAHKAARVHPVEIIRGAT
jgi:lipoprotein-releasing system permease protein